MSLSASKSCPIRDKWTLLICVAASLIFAFLGYLCCFRAYGELAVYLLYGGCFFAALFALWHGGYLEDKNRLVASLLLAMAAFALRIANLDARSGDYNSFLESWVQFYRDGGGFAALGTPVGNYNFPYMYILAAISYLPIDDLYLIKLVSVFFDVVLAYFVLKLVELFTENRNARLAAFFIVLLLPTVWLNSAWWAQCDSIYASFALGALYFGLKKRPVLAMLFAAVSFSFKLQAIFLLPIFAVLLMCGRIKWRHIPFFPLFFAIMMLPAIIAGRPPIDAILIYINQTGEYSSNITLNAPTLAAFFEDYSLSVSTVSTALIVLTALFLCALLWYAWRRRKALDDKLIVRLALAICIGIPFLLPFMHERYFYIAEILSVACAAAGLVHFAAPALVQTASLICYDAYMLTVYRFRLELAAAFMLVSLALALTAIFVGKGKRVEGAPLKPSADPPPIEKE